MGINTKRKKIAMSFVLIAVFIGTAFGQQKNSLYDHYQRIGIHTAMDNYFSGGKSTGVPLDSPVIYQPYYYPSMSFGINTFVLKREKFNLKIGLRASYLAYSYKMVIQNGQIPSINEDVIDFATDRANFIKFGIPITGEYFIQINKKRKLTIFTTLIPSYWSSNEWLAASLTYEVIYNRYKLPRNIDNPLYFDTQIGLSYYIPTRYALVQPFVYYNKSFRNIWEDVPFQIRGIRNRSYNQFSGTTSQSGDHISFGFNLYIKKSKAYLKRQEKKLLKKKSSS